MPVAPGQGDHHGVVPCDSIDGGAVPGPGEDVQEAAYQEVQKAWVQLSRREQRGPGSDSRCCQGTRYDDQYSLVCVRRLPRLVTRGPHGVAEG